MPNPLQFFRAAGFVLSLAMIGLGAPTKVHAQMTEAGCATSWGVVMLALGAEEPAPPLTLSHGWCLVLDHEVQVGNLSLRADAVSWAVSGLDGLLTSGAFLDRIDGVVRGLRVVPRTGLPEYDYVLGAQSDAETGIAIDLSARYADGRLDLSRFEVAFPGDNSLSLTVAMDGILPGQPRAGRLTDAGIEVSTHGLFETYALAPMVAALFDTTQPIAPQVATWRSATQQRIADLPEAFLPGDSRAALIALLDDFPNPRGRIRLELVTETGLPLTQIFEDAGLLGVAPVSDLHQALAGSALRLDYTPDQEAPLE